ncbi:expressed unknown protein [Seminavis robusta]|uniref:Uncharacterized protein n=1 Tax=Seminavis robusta TaxID=568900 RepID=A0A9N8EQC5_9STRA|nr:expressed unknown protein [Seminavis robusta]|eukprot:Sro1667_g289760.1 n/a (104) ;mRNA; r:3634-4049
MALTILNYFYWEIPEATYPFAFADAVLIAALFRVDQGMRAAQETSESIAEKQHQENVTEKDDKRSQKAATRDLQKRNSKQQKNLNKNKNAHHNIQQPSKSKRN